MASQRCGAMFGNKLAADCVAGVPDSKGAQPAVHPDILTEGEPYTKPYQQIKQSARIVWYSNSLHIAYHVVIIVSLYIIIFI